MIFKRSEWNAYPSQLLNSKIAQFNAMNSRPKAPPKKRLTTTWGKAFTNALRYYEKQMDKFAETDE